MLRRAICDFAGSVWAAIADSAHAHRLILISTFILSTLTRGAMVLTGSYQAQLALTVLTEMFGAPIPIIGDATVMASVKEVQAQSHPHCTPFATSAIARPSQPESPAWIRPAHSWMLRGMLWP